MQTTFPWAAVTALAVITLIIWVVAHQLAHRRNTKLQTVIYSDHLDVFATECFERAKSIPTDLQRELDIEVAQIGDNDVVRFSRIPGKKHLENYEITYSNGRVKRVATRFGDDLVMASDSPDDFASAVMKLHSILQTTSLPSNIPHEQN